MSFYAPLHHQNSNQVGVIEYISFFMYIRSVTGYSNNSSSCTYIRFQIQTRLRTMNRRPHLLHLLCTGQQATSKNPRTSRRVGNRRSSRCYDLILFPKLGEPEKFPIRKLQCLLQSNHSTPQCVVMRIRALVRIVRVINATSSSLSGKFVLIYLVLLLFNRLLPAKTVTVSTQTSRLGKFSYFGPLDILDVIPPSLDLITFENIVISRGT